ncbi:MAG: hypothetical protein RL557_708 [archaeon]|jgi:Icc-related predicted phosphoesterase
MKLLAIGDPHGNINQIKKIPLKGVDVIVLTGDLGRVDLDRKMAFENLRRKNNGLPPKEFSAQQRRRAFMQIYNSSIKVVSYLSKHAPVRTIYGNVEYTDKDTKKLSKKIGYNLPLLSKELKKLKVKIINDTLLKINNTKIGGLKFFLDTNWVKDFKPTEYKKRMEKARKETEKARQILQKFGKVDLLVCHQPPHGILDKVQSQHAPKNWQGKHAGSKLIADYIKKKQPKYVFCGHIHEGQGSAKIGKTEVYNLGVCGWKMVEM